jgi:hypothetical protein
LPLWFVRSLQGERDHMSDFVANKDHRSEGACDDREKKTSCDGVLHREGPQSKVASAFTQGTGVGEGRDPLFGQERLKLPPEV